MLSLSLLYPRARRTGIDGALFGIKAAVLVIVIEALIASASEHSNHPYCSLAAAAFVGIFFLALPFPANRRGSCADRLCRRAPGSGTVRLSGKVESVPPPAKDRWRQFAIASAVGIVVWWAPIAFAALIFGSAACPGEHRHIFFKTGSRQFWRRLRPACLYGAGSGPDIRLDDGVRDGRRTRPCRDDPGTAYSRHAIRRLPCRIPQRSAIFTSHSRRTRCRDNDVGDVRAFDAMDFRRRAVCGTASGQSPAVRRTRCHHCRGSRRRDLESFRLFALHVLFGKVTEMYGAARWYAFNPLALDLRAPR